MTISSSTFSFVSDLIRQQAAIVLSPGKEYLVESRLLPLAREAGLDDVGALVAQLQRRPDDLLRRQIVEAMTTNETSFFRDRDPFNALTQAILPELCTRRAASRRINIWSAACSTGQEPYSIAMSVVDHPLVTPDWRVDVLATDINNEILERARRARYSQLEVNRGLPAAMLVRHFERVDTDWRVVAPVQEAGPLHAAESRRAIRPAADGRRLPAQRLDLLRSRDEVRGPAPREANPAS